MWTTPLRAACRSRCWRLWLGVGWLVGCGTSCTDAVRVGPGLAAETDHEICGPPPEPEPLRRLSPRQLENTLRDLFPAVDLPPFTLVGNAAGSQFDHLAHGQVPSELWTYQAYQVAVSVAGAVVATPDAVPCPPDGGPQPRDCGEQYIRELADLAFRRPATAQEIDEIVELFIDGLAAGGFRHGLRLAVQAVLLSPGFIYLASPGTTVDDSAAAYALASRLSYFLWNTMPDAELLEAANAGSLLDENGLLDQAQRMLSDGRTRVGVSNFYRQILELDEVSKIVSKAFAPELFDEQVRADMREELDYLVLSVMFDGDATIEELLTTRETWVTAGLAKLYGVDPPYENEGRWARRTLDANTRAGVLTSVGFLAAHALNTEPSPVRRGVFVLSNLLCTPPAPPPPGLETATDAVGGSNLGGDDAVTNRERYAAHVADPQCQGCHVPIDGVGFGFEGYDVFGQVRMVDNGFPVDDSGRVTLDGEIVEFHGVVELAYALAASPMVQSCATEQWLTYALARPLEERDRCTVEYLSERLADSGGSIDQLLLDIVLSRHFRQLEEESK